MREVICPDCSEKLGSIDTENLIIIVEEGVVATKPTMSGDLIVISYDCPICGKSKPETLVI